MTSQVPFRLPKWLGFRGVSWGASQRLSLSHSSTQIKWVEKTSTSELYWAPNIHKMSDLKIILSFQSSFSIRSLWEFGEWALGEWANGLWFDINQLTDMPSFFQEGIQFQFGECGDQVALHPPLDSLGCCWWMYSRVGKWWITSNGALRLPLPHFGYHGKEKRPPTLPRVVWNAVSGAPFLQWKEHKKLHQGRSLVCL